MNWFFKMCLFVPSFPSLGWIQNFARSMRGPKCVLEMWPGEKTRETPHGFAKTSQPSCPGKEDPIKSATCWRVVKMPSMMRRNHPGHSVGPAPPGKVSELQRWHNQRVLVAWSWPRAGAPVRLWFLPSLLMLHYFQTCILRNFCFGFAGCVAQNQVSLVMWRQEELLGHGHTGQDTLPTLQLTFVLRYGLAKQAYNKIEKSNFD